MSKLKASLTATLSVTLAIAASAAGPQAGKAPAPLTDADKTQIRDLSQKYGRGLGFCEDETYAGVYAPDGAFASGPRGKVSGHDKLVALVRSERHCSDGSEKHLRNLPKSMDIQPSPEGATAMILLEGTPGHYEDTYVKTAQGWRIKLRTYISTQEEAAHLTARDFNEIRQISGNDTGQFDDIYSTGPTGKQFRSSGIVINPSPEGAIGKATLKADGGRYDDVYVKTSQGWRFKSRAYVAAAEGATKN